MTARRVGDAIAIADHSDHAHVDEVDVSLVSSADRATFAVLVEVPHGRLFMTGRDGRDLARRLLDAVHDLERMERGQPPVRGVDHPRSGGHLS